MKQGDVLSKKANSPRTRSRIPSTEVRATAKRERKTEKMVLRKFWMRARMELMREATEEVMLVILKVVWMFGFLNLESELEIGFVGKFEWMSG